MMGTSVKSSRKYSHSHQGTNLLEEEEEEEEEEGGSWLQLGLGGSFGATATSNTSQEHDPVVPSSGAILTISSHPQHETMIDLNQDYTTSTREIVLDHQQHPMISMTSLADDHDELPRPFPTCNMQDNSSKSGLWFTLRTSSSLYVREGAMLPQIPKAYIRVKDENVTVFMVKKYLVRKLGLSNESEIEIWCMGQKLMPAQTLKQVRDCVWLPRLVESVNSAAAAAAGSFDAQDFHLRFSNHLMSLHYGRR